MPARWPCNRAERNIMTYSIVPNDKLRALCIKNNWFTCGSNAQYCHIQ